MAIVIENNHYSWYPSRIKYRNQATGLYSGDVIGSTPLEVYLAEITAAGTEQKELVAQIGSEWAAVIRPFANRYARIMEIANDVATDIVASLDGILQAQP